MKALSNLKRVVETFRSDGNMPPFDGATGWLNSPPLTPADLHGKVVVVQFWTFTCINWLRTLAYVRAWSERYKDNGLVVIGVHTPEFSFEHDQNNIRRSAGDLRMEYPIAIDNAYSIWDGFANSYWPALYLVDASRRIRHHHVGEGAYEESERLIQQLLGEAGATGIPVGPVIVEPRGAEVAADWDNLGSPETYLGYARTENFASLGGVLRSSPRHYTAEQLKLNHWALDGDWTFENEFVASNEPGARIVYQFHARDLHLVMGPAVRGAAIRFKVKADGLVPRMSFGSDLDDQGNGVMSEQRLYQLIRQPLPIADRRFEIEFLDPGAAAYAFTFG